MGNLNDHEKANTDLSSLRSGKTEDPNFADATFNPNATVDMQANKTKKRGAESSGGDDMTMIIALVVVGAVVMVIMKGKKKKKKK